MDIRAKHGAGDETTNSSKPGTQPEARQDAAPLRFVFYRPHANIWFKPPVKNIINGQRLPAKYGPLFDHVVASGARVYFSTALMRAPGLKGLLKWLLEPFELIAWCVLNKLPLRKVGLVLAPSGLKDKDVLFLMHYGTFTHEDETEAARGSNLARRLAAADIVKVVHMTHFAYNAAIGAANLAHAVPDLLVAENDLAKNSPFFRRFFSGVPSRFETLAYTASLRFQRLRSFETRTHKMVATGSITYRMRDPDYIDFFQVDELQPLRRTLFDNAARFAGEMDCLISDLNASRQSTSSAPRASPPRGWLHGLFARWEKHPQMNYYRQNIVDVYNSYTMFVVPEEICNLPAIGFIEGMACGCVYLGTEDPMYTDIGMVPGVHYLAYDGSLDGLMATVRDCQQPGGISRLAAISERGTEFATRVMSAENVYGEFMSRLAQASRSP